MPAFDIFLNLGLNYQVMWFRYYKLLRGNLELLFWVAGLAVLFFMPVSDSHFSLCVPSSLGFNWCPGCGLGHSIHYYLHLDFSRGWEEHILGAFALPMILYRIFQLLNIHFNNKTTIS